MEFPESDPTLKVQGNDGRLPERSFGREGNEKGGGMMLSVSTAVIAVGLVLGLYFQNRRVDDLRSEMKTGFGAIDKRFDDLNKRFDDLRDFVRTELKRLEESLNAQDSDLGKEAKRG
jgi:hypothetical protein